MTDRCFIDSNIWFYLLGKSSKDAQKSLVIEKILEESLVFVSTQVVNEVTKNFRYKYGFTHQENMSVISYFYDDFQVQSFNREILELGCVLREKYSGNLDGQRVYWDSMIVAVALYMECDILYSEDLHNGMVVENRLKIINPFV